MKNLDRPTFNVVLVEPEIPQNTGSIGRTCVGTRCRLHLVGRLGFEIDEKAVRRAGLDYWEHVDLYKHETLEEALSHKAPGESVYYFTKKARMSLFDVAFKTGDWLVFGRETTGLDESLLRKVEDQTVRIPLWGPIRSLNLSNAVSIVTYEGIRQLIASSELNL